MSYTEVTSVSQIPVDTTAYIGDNKTSVTILAAPGGKRRFMYKGSMIVVSETFTSAMADGVTTVTSDGLDYSETIYIES